MAMEKKQQMMLGAIVVCVLGMGGMFLLRGGSETQQTTDSDKVVKRVRDMGSDARNTRVKKKSRKRASKAPATVQKRVREEVERKSNTKRRRKAKRAGKEKKRTVAPAM